MNKINCYLSEDKNAKRSIEIKEIIVVEFSGIESCCVSLASFTRSKSHNMRTYLIENGHESLTIREILMTKIELAEEPICI